MDPRNASDDGRGIVRIGGTVRKPTQPRAPYVRAVLARLEQRGIAWSPRFLGVDALGRETLSYIAGEVGIAGAIWTDDQLVQLAALARQLHDALTGTPEAEDAETVRHCDLAPWNTIVRDGQAYAFIDFDGARPGRRIDDLGYLVWTFCGIGPDGGSVDDVGRRLCHFCDAYASGGGPRPHTGLLDSVLSNQSSVLAMRLQKAAETSEARQRTFQHERAVAIQACIAWTRTQRGRLEACLR